MVKNYNTSLKDFGIHAKVFFYLEKEYREEHCFLI